MTSLLRALTLRARLSNLNCSLFISLTLARFAQWLRASRPRRHTARARFAYSGFRRFACLMMVAVMFVQFALFPPEVSHAAVKAVSAKAASYGQDTHFWWHSSGWAARSERFLRENFPKFGAGAQQRNWDGKGAPRRAVPKPRPQETQEERNARVTRVEISPREATVAAGQEIHFIAVAYDANNSPVGGVSFDWEKENEDTGEKIIVEERGKFSSAGRFSSAKEGNYRVKARFGAFEASAKVKVKGVKYLSGQQPIGTRTVSSRDLPQPSRSSLSSPATKDRIAKNAPGRFATRYSSAGTRAMPRLLPLLPDEFGWNDGNFTTADDPGKERGEPPGHPPDGGAGSSNFHFAAPVLSLSGRGQDLNFGLSYNSRVWHKANSEMTFDIDHDWPAPGWSLGFGKIVGMGGQNGYMIVEPDGTRRPYTCSLTIYTDHQDASCKTTDGSFIDYRITGDTPANGGAPISGGILFPNGMDVAYGHPANNAVYPSIFWERNGNIVYVSYRNNQGPQIDRITDTLERVVQFYYDSNNLPVAITGPGFDGTTRTLVRITYDGIDLRNLGGSYGFSGLTPMVRNNVIPVIKAIYYPASKTGYWFGDPGSSYSAYGMLAKVIEQRGMDFSGAPLGDPYQPADPGTITPGLMTRQIVYDYQMTASGLTAEPFYLNSTETWANMDVAAPVTQYFVQENASPRRVEITRPDGVKTVMLSHNAPGQWYDGLIYQDETYNPQGALLGKSFVQWEQGDYSSPRPSRVETTDERGQTSGKEFSYGPRFNQVTETREYGYGYVFGGANTLLRRTVNQYLNDPDYTDPLPQYPYIWHHIFNLVTVNEVYGGDGARMSRTEYFYDQFKGAAGLINTPGVIGYEHGMNPHNLPEPEPLSLYTIYKKDTRGNVTTIKRYADAATLDESSAVVEIRHYDITGNVRKAETSCCQQTTFDYTLNTQYAWPESQTSGSPSDASKQNTTRATYDLNTGLVKTSTDANDRTTPPTIYDPNTLRPLYEYSPTGAYQYHIYDDLNMSVADFVYEAGPSGDNIASRSDKYLDGLGRVIKEIAYGKDYAQDVVEIKYDQLGRVSQQSRPYRAGATPLWSTVTYDFLDRPVQTTAPDNSVVSRSYNQPDPPGSSGQPGETIKMTDPWGRERWARSDALGRMVEVAEPDPNGNGSLSSGAMFTIYSYDALDRLAQVDQGAQTRRFRYDSLGRLTHQKLAERDATLTDIGDWVGGGSWSDVFSYDTRSNLIRSVDARGVKTYFIYNDDPLNRLLAVQYDKSGSPPHLINNIPTAPNVSYDYMTATPGDKRRVHNVYVDGGMGNEVMSYDSEGRLSQVYQTFTGRESYPIVTDYIWDSLDRLKENTYPQQYTAGEIRKKVEPAYDVASRIESLKFGGATYASAPVYNAASQITSLKIGDQISENYEDDPKTGLLTNQKVIRGGAETLLDLKYNYTTGNDANNNGPKTGQLTGITDLKNQARNRAYEYDKLGRLVKVKGGVNAFTNPNWYQTYSYDRYGNRSMVQRTDVGMVPARPGSQSRSDLISSITTDFLNNDSDGTHVRGGPRVTEEESGNAPSANGGGGKSLVNRSPDTGHGNVPSADGAGGKLRAEHPAGAPPRAPEKKYGYRGDLSRSPVAVQSIVTVYPSVYQTPAPPPYPGFPSASAVTSPSNTGHGETYAGASAYPIGQSWGIKSCRWFGFQPVSGQISRITLKLDWSTSGSIGVDVPDFSGPGSAEASFNILLSANNGSYFGSLVSRGETIWSLYGPNSDYRSFSDSGSFSIDLSVNTPIDQIIVEDRLYTYADASYASANANVYGTISNIRLEVEIDPTPPVISNVAAGGITATGATITWNTNENADTQVEYGTTTAYGQATTLNSSLVTSHSQGLSGLTNGTLYHYRVKSKDAAGNLTTSGDFTFTTLDTIAPAISNVAAGSVTAAGATITWTTNENSDSQVEYGTTTAYGQSTTINPALVTSHSQGLSGLNSGTLYHYRVKSKDVAGNLAVSGDFTFTTADITAPVISNVASGGVSTTGATISWNTNENSDSQVEYGTTTAYGQSTTINPALVTSHSQGLSGLNSGTLYHYRVKSKDVAGNLAISGDFTFTTADITAPVISDVAAVSVTDTSATITWTTNENSDSQVEYGTTTAYGQSTALNPALVTAHSQGLSALTPGTVYHYRVKSRDASGNLVVSGDFSFTTTQSVSIPLDGLASLSYNLANNRIITPGFEYDPAGNQTRAVVDTSGTQQQYRYDCAGRLAQVLDASGNVLATYSYGAGNQRLMSVEGGVTKYFAWARGKIIAEYEAWGTNALIWKTSYVYLGGRLLATTSGADGSETRFHHADRLGTRLVTAADGTVVTEQLTMPFGTMLPFTQTYGGGNSYQHPTLSNPSKKRFTTYDRSDATGLDYAVNRFYSSQQGRFTQVDPAEMNAANLSNPQTLNLYAYCGNDPINRSDPDGLGIVSFFKAIGRAIAAFFGAGGRVSSGPDFRTPPTFPGSLPGINAAARSGMGGFRTPPFVSGFSDDSSVSGVGWFGNGRGNCGGPGEPTCEGGTTLRVATQEREKSLLEDFLDFAQKSDLPGIHYDPDVPDHLEMGITYGALLRLLAQWGLRARTGAAGSRMVTVSRWGRAGLQEGDWVMKGGATRWNYIRSFKWEPSSKIFGKYGNEFAPFRSGQTFEVPASAVRWPPISQFYKGFFGQRIFRP